MNFRPELCGKNTLLSQRSLPVLPYVRKCTCYPLNVRGQANAFYPYYLISRELYRKRTRTRARQSPVRGFRVSMKPSPGRSYRRRQMEVLTELRIQNERQRMRLLNAPPISAFYPPTQPAPTS